MTFPSEEEVPPIVLHHQPCDQTAEPVLVCAHCSQEITAHNVTPEPGPGFRADLSGDAKNGVLIDDSLEVAQRRAPVDREKRSRTRR